ncbi:MAG: hypothetical protein ACP5U2_02295 [Bryobacteraceae bacterium]
MKRALAGVLLATAASAAIRGVVVNRTTGKPAAGIAVKLVSMSAAGMQAAETVTADAQGRFQFSKTPEAVHYLVEAELDGVAYHRMVPPDETSGEIELEVYEVTARPAPRPAQRIVVLEPGAGALRVGETWLYRNDGKRTLFDPSAGSLRFYVPDAAQGEISVMVTAPGGMPVRRVAQKEPGSGFYRVGFPIKPGETRFDIGYTLPVASTFATRMPYPEAPVRLVTPAGVTLSGDGLETLGPDPSGRAMIYEMRGRREFSVQVAGRGVLADASEEAGPSPEQILPAIYDRLGWVLGPAVAALVLGLLLLYRTSPPLMADRRFRRP